MFEIIGYFVLGGFLLFWLVYVFVFNIVYICSKFRCRRKKYDYFMNPCHDENCSVCSICECYDHIYTHEEIEELLEMLNE